MEGFDQDGMFKVSNVQARDYSQSHAVCAKLEANADYKHRACC